jgi:hypothetical protein
MITFSSLSTNLSIKQELLRSPIVALEGRLENRSFRTGFPHQSLYIQNIYRRMVFRKAT